jgi:sugar phosphate isomerase/epimerase
MVWRVDQILDFYRQIEWIKAHGFDVLEFWTAPGKPDVWQGFDVETAGRGDILALKQAVAGFAEVDIHAHFDEAGIQHAPPPGGAVAMERTFALAAEIGAAVITVHPHATLAEADEISALEKLNALGVQYGVQVGVEPMGGAKADALMGLVARLDLPVVGITLDTGHMHFEQGAAFQRYGSLGNQVRTLKPRIVHVHAHDYNGQDDHLGIGHGYIDFVDILSALHEAAFTGSLVLELNPFREAESAAESRKRLQAMIDAAYA